MIEINNKKDCCGCTACMATCHKHAITMVADEEGFLYPQVDKNACDNCGACSRVCPVQSPILETTFYQKAVLFQHGDARILRESTSGGLFTAIAEWVIARGGIVYGAAYDGGFTIRHVGVERLENLDRFRNSKYAQSEIGNTFNKIRTLLCEDRWVLFSGTPCQLEGLHKFLRKPYERLVMVDVICHACPSPLLFRKWIEVNERHCGKQATNIKFRDKVYGYKYSAVTMYDDDGKLFYKEGIDTDVMLRAFFNNISPRPSCFACPSKKQYHVTDFSIWDCFDVGKFSRELDNDKGVTRALLHTDKAHMIWEDIASCGMIKEIPVAAAVEGVHEMYYSVPKNPRRTDFFRDLNQLPTEDVFRKYFPVTLRHKAEKFIRMVAYRLGVYTLTKKAFKAVMGRREIKR